MKVIIRVDSSLGIGSGHVMRCLTLADQLAARGAEIGFVCRERPGAMIEFVVQRGYSCERLTDGGNDSAADAADTATAIRHRFPQGVDWLVVDHYDLDAAWERLMRPQAQKIMVIDDLANRAHDCDLLLDQNYYRGLAHRYDGLVPDSTRLLLGPRYVLLRPDFFAARRTLRQRDGVVRRMLVFLGGSDPTNQTGCALQAIDEVLRPDIHVDVVVGNTNPHQAEIQAFCDSHPWVTYHCQISNMAELIAAADLAIGAGGTTTWERCILGLPSLTVVLADNQLLASTDVAATGATICLGWARDSSVSRYKDAIDAIICDRIKLQEMSEASLALVPAKEGSVAEALLECGQAVGSGLIADRSIGTEQ